MTETAENWPQPWEGVNGTVRDGDDLLSLEESAIPRRDMMIGMARCLSSATLVGQPAPVVRRMSDRMRAPQPGDLVFERTMTSRGGDSALKGFGILLLKRREWAETDEDFAREMADEPEEFRGDDNRCTDTAWYVQYGPGERDICRWVNAEFTAIPVDDGEFTRFYGTPTESGGVSVDRNDLLASLADSGFILKVPHADGL